MRTAPVLQSLFAEAIQHFQASRFAQADAVCRQILAQDANHAHALNLLGVLALRANRPDDAEQLIRQALARAPGNAEILGNLGSLQLSGGQDEEAIVTFQSVVDSQPDNAYAWQHLAGAFSRTGRSLDAIACHERLISLNPKYAGAHFSIGSERLGRGELDEAIASFRKVIMLQPDHANAYINLGAALTKLGRHGEAAESLRHAIMLKPEHAAAHANLAATHMHERRWDEAITCYAKAIELAPGNASVLSNLGNAMRHKGRLDEAESLLRRSLEIQPCSPETLVIMGNVFYRKSDLDQSEAFFRKAIELDPNHAVAHTNLGNVLRKKGRLDEALTHYRCAIELKPDLAEAHTNLAFLNLLQGRFAEGWPSYEWRWNMPHVPLLPGKITQPQWDGGDIAGKTMLLHAEQGLGDTLQFIRYVEPLAARGARLVLAVTTPVRRLLEQSKVIGRHQIISLGDAVPPFDVHCPLLSLPMVMQTRLESIPCGLAYLRAADVDVATWRALLAVDTATMRIGIAWAGNRQHADDHNRSMSLSLLAPLFEAVDDSVSFYSLQKGDGPGHAAALVAGTQLQPAPREFEDLADTAALMTNLDLIISVDTAVAHLAGGLGRPVWTLLPFDPDWRWLLDREDSPWYPSMRLFRQPAPGDWAAVIARVAEALAVLQRTR